MEVDGRICEIGGEVSGVLVRSRNLREQKIRDRMNLNDKQTGEDLREEFKEFSSENVVFETKSKWVDNIMNEDNDGLDNMQINKNQQKAGPKKLNIGGSWEPGPTKDYEFLIVELSWAGQSTNN